MTLRLERDNEVVLISPYGLENVMVCRPHEKWFGDLLEDLEADIEALQDEGFELVN